MNTKTVSSQIVVASQRIQHTANLFGIFFPLQVEPTIYQNANCLSQDYKGGYWEFHQLSNAGFYMSPCLKQQLNVEAENGYQGVLSTDAFGIATCLYAYSQLSFSSTDWFAEICAHQYHLLREFMFEHAEAREILRAVD